MPRFERDLSVYRSTSNQFIRHIAAPHIMTPGIGLMKRRLENEKSAISLGMAGIAKMYDVSPQDIKALESKYHDETGDWYVALGWPGKKAVVRMDSVFATITEIKEI